MATGPSYVHGNAWVHRGRAARRDTPKASAPGEMSAFFLNEGLPDAITAPRWRVAFAPWFPLSAGSDAARVSGAIAEVAARHQATPAQVAIAWLLAMPV
jgi:hypothetical protein